jgi:hypothetical protein
MFFWFRFRLIGFAMPILAITTQCYDERVAVLRVLLGEILVNCQASECSAELAVYFEQEARRLGASIWAMHAEVELD